MGFFGGLKRVFSTPERRIRTFCAEVLEKNGFVKTWAGKDFAMEMFTYRKRDLVFKFYCDRGDWGLGIGVSDRDDHSTVDRNVFGVHLILPYLGLAGERDWKGLGSEEVLGLLSNNLRKITDFFEGEGRSSNAEGLRKFAAAHSEQMMEEMKRMNDQIHRTSKK